MISHWSDLLVSFLFEKTAHRIVLFIQMLTIKITINITATKFRLLQFIGDSKWYLLIDELLYILKNILVLSDQN